MKPLKRGRQGGRLERNEWEGEKENELQISYIEKKSDGREK